MTVQWLLDRMAETEIIDANERTDQPLANPTSTVVVQPAVFSCFFGHDFVVSPWVVVQVWL